LSAASFFDMSEKCKQNAQKVGHRVVLAPALSHSSQLGYFGWIMGLSSQYQEEEVD
jgi:hypothetical protein